MDMILNGHGLPVISVKELPREAKWLKDLLSQHQIVPPEASAFARCLDELEYYASGFKRGLNRRRSVVNYFFYGRVLGLAYLIGALRRALTRTPLDAFTHHLDVFMGRTFLLAGRSGQSESQDRAWELLAGCLVGSFAQDLAMTDGRGIDISCKHAGLRLGTECKVLYSKNPVSQADALVTGARQLEASSVDMGVVVAYATNAVLPFRLQTSPLRDFSTPDLAMSALDQELRLSVGADGPDWLVHRLADESGARRTEAKTRAVLYVAQAIVKVRGTETLLTTALPLRFRTLEVPEVESFIKAFRDSTQVR
jgi:hypothetical protein